MSATMHGIETNMADQGVYDRAIQRFRDNKIALPTFAQLAADLLADVLINPTFKDDVGKSGPCHSGNDTTQLISATAASHG